jgi:phosphate:Na+ symporter
MSPAAIASLLFAGLGLFFIGVKLIGSHLTQIAGRGFRRQIPRLVERAWTSSLLGILFGALTQSTNAVTFIMTSMVTAGMIPVRAAMPVVIWANLGTSALVLLASVDIHFFVLCLLGFVGAGYFFNIDKSQRYRHATAALLGLALLFLGLDFLKQGATPLREFSDVRELLALAAESYWLVFALGAALTLAVQSSATVTVVALAMTRLELLGMDQTLIVIYGAGLGSALSLMFLSSNLEGTPRQLATVQVILKILSSVLMVGLFMIETGFEVPLVKALIAGITTQTSLQGAWAYLLMQLAGCIVVTALANPLQRLAERLSPATREEERSKPRFLYEQALDDAPTALDLVAQEQSWQLHHLLGYLTSADRATSADASVAGEPDSLLLADQRVVATTRSFLTELMDRTQDRDLLDRMLNHQSRNQLLGDLQDALYRFNALVTLQTPEPDGQAIVQGMVEGIDFTLLTLLDAVRSSTREDRALLLELTADKSSLMEGLRHRFLSGGHGLSAQAHEALFSAFSLFERLLWLLRQYGLLIEAPAREDA